MTKRKKLGAILLGAILALGVGAGIAPKNAVATQALITYKQVTSVSQINTIDIFKLGFEYNSATYLFDGTVASNGLNFSTAVTSAGDVKFETGTNGYKIKNGTKYIHNTGAQTNISLSTSETPAEWNFFVTDGENSLPIAHYNSNRFIGRTSGTATNAKAYAASNFASGTYPAVFVYKGEETFDVVTELSVNPPSKSLLTNAALLEADYTVSITKNGSAGSNEDYTAQIGTGTGSGFVGTNIVWGTTTPKLTDTTIQFRAKYPQNSGGSTYLTADVALTVTAPAATSVNVTAAGDATTVKVSKTLQLSAEVLPFGSNQLVTWSSSNNSFATVNSSSGLVTGVAVGDVTIIATSTTPSIIGSILLSVVDPYANADGIEDFESQTVLTASYSTSSFVGDSGVTFSWGESRNEGLGTADDYSIDGKGIMLRRASDSYLQFTLPNGLTSLEFEYRKAFTGNSARQLELLINGTQVKTGNEFGTTEPDPTVHTFSYTPSVPHSGSTIVKIKNVGTTTGNRQITIDNIVWINGPDVSFGALDSLAINADSVKKTYYEGESLSLSGLVAMAYDVNDNEKNVTNEIASTPAEGYVFTAADAGTKTITIYYTEGKTVNDSFEVTVIAIINPTHLIADVGSKNANEGDSGTIIPVETDLKEVFGGTKIDLLESATVEIDEGDIQSRMYYAGTSNIKGGIQPLKFGSGSGKGNVKFTFSDEIEITKVTLYVARLGTGATAATMQVVGADAQTIGKASTVDAMHAPYEFIGDFGHELVVRNNSNIATYLYGIDIEYSTSDPDVVAVDDFVDTYMFMDAIEESDLGTGECKSEGYYTDAKAAFNALTTEQRELFVSDAKYDAPRARLIAWAIANNEGLITSDNTLGSIVNPSQNTMFNGLNDSNTIMLIVIISLISVSVLGGVFYLRKKEQN